MLTKEFIKSYGDKKIDKDLLDGYINIQEISFKDSCFGYNSVENDCLSYDDAVLTLFAGNC